MNGEPWAQFAVGTPSQNPNRPNRDCQPLVSVSHVAHVRVALRIVEDQKLHAGLVHDESILNTQRIRVVWLSPNDWTNAGGFRYGNVRFSFNWRSLVANKRYYWVESIAYGVNACRILITDNNYDGHLWSYDPTRTRGPWVVAPDGNHYWNGHYCLEVMFESDLPLETATWVDFVKHHPHRCSIAPRMCPDGGRIGPDAAAEFVGTIVSRNNNLWLPGFITEFEGTAQASQTLILADMMLRNQCYRLRPPIWGNLSAHDPYAPVLARSLLRSLTLKDLEGDAPSLVSFFQNADEAGRAIRKVIWQAAGLTYP